jgi:hypothetical protein
MTLNKVQSSLSQHVKMDSCNAYELKHAC